MSEETKHGLREHQKSGFERQDLGAQAVFAFLMSLAVGGVLVFLVVWGAYQFLDMRQRAHQPQLSPLAKPVEADTRSVSPGEIMKFPQPRLEQNERVEINDFRLNEEQTLNSYGWVDKKSGVVRIPIERAMQLLTQRGLPTTPKPGTVPPAETNMAATGQARQQTKEKKK